MRSGSIWLTGLVFAACVGHAQIARKLSVTAEPATPLIEHRDERQLLEFDFAVRNEGSDTLRLVEIEMSAFDSASKLELRKTVNGNGLRPGIDVIVPGLIRPGEVMDVFNPFFAFEPGVHFARLEFAFRFLVENSEKEAEANRHRLPMDFDLERRISVSPADYKPKTALFLPLHGRILVWDGHDFFAHHRRIPLNSEQAEKIGLHAANANRYAADLVVVDERGAMFQGDPFQKASYYSYGQPIYAPGDGRVHSSRNDVPDNEYLGRTIRYPKLPPGVGDDLGNFVIIDHGNGEFSVLPHMKLGSVRVKAGDRVQAGQMIGEVGFSGDAIFPHVHYALVSGAEISKHEGLPVYFRNVTRILGGGKKVEAETALASGDIVESSSSAPETSERERK